MPLEQRQSDRAYWDRDRFDTEFGLQNGTTYNSFLIQGEQTALVDTSHEKFRQLYLDVLMGVIDPTQLDYLIISHTEPDHSGQTAMLVWKLKKPKMAVPSSAMPSPIWNALSKTG